MQSKYFALVLDIQLCFGYPLSWVMHFLPNNFAANNHSQPSTEQLLTCAKSMAFFRRNAMDLMMGIITNEKKLVAFFKTIETDLGNSGDAMNFFAFICS